MPDTDGAQSLEQVLSTLVAEALARDVDPAIAKAAKAATLRAVGSRLGPVTSQTRRRAQAYFSAVVRREVVRSGSSPRAAARFVVASVIQDLRQTGRSGADIWDELRRGWSQRVPGDVLEEYRLRLCG
jgi:hypothetical protein